MDMKVLGRSCWAHQGTSQDMMGTDRKTQKRMQYYGCLVEGRMQMEGSSRTQGVTERSNQ